jgi:transcriptional regulator with XRE-family HTH domain
VRAARALAGMSQAELADQSGVSLSALKDFERNFSTLIPATMEMLVQALLRAGVEVSALEPGGVRFIPGRSPPIGDEKTAKRLVERGSPADGR